MEVNKKSCVPFSGRLKNHPDTSSRLDRYAISRDHRRNLDEIGKRVSSLTNREREVLQGVVSGMLNKQIGAQLGITEKTVKVHRAHVMEKMGVSSVAELARMVAEFERLSATGRPE
jgi:FixJ family two-component response regulator